MFSLWYKKHNFHCAILNVQFLAIECVHVTIHLSPLLLKLFSLYPFNNPSPFLFSQPGEVAFFLPLNLTILGNLIKVGSHSLSFQVWFVLFSIMFAKLTQTTAENSCGLPLTAKHGTVTGVNKIKNSLMCSNIPFGFAFLCLKNFTFLTNQGGCLSCFFSWYPLTRKLAQCNKPGPSSWKAAF